jgi:diguanylate cyclase (GGDEF)-like protein
MKLKWNSLTTKTVLLIVGIILICGISLIGLTARELIGSYEHQINIQQSNELAAIKFEFEKNVSTIESDVELLRFYIMETYDEKKVSNKGFQEILKRYFSEYLQNDTAATYSIYAYFEPSSESDICDVWITNQEGSFIRHEMIPYERYVNQDNMSWYYDVKSVEESLWVLPYRNRYNEYITSYVAPLIKEDEVVGIIGMYLDVYSVRNKLAPLNIDRNKYYWVVNNQNEIIYHPILTEGTMNPLTTTKQNSDYFEELIDGEMYRHYTSTTSNGWTFISSINKASILEERLVILRKTLIVFIMFMGLLITVLVLFTKKYTNTLNHMIIILNKARRGDFSDVLPVDSRDEIGTLALAMNQTFDTISHDQVKLERLCFYNSQTNLPNLEKLKSDLKLFANRDMALYLLDLDNFRTINDLLGKQKSDEFITEISKKLRDAEDRSLYIYQISGDEFAFLEFDPELQLITENADYIINLFKQLAFSTAHNIAISTSIGIAKYPDDVTLSGGLIDCAHTALLNAKREGKNNFKLFSRFLPSVDTNNVIILDDLKRAIAQDEFIMHYQPIFNKKNEILSLEAFVRWNHPRDGVLLPLTFLHLVEQVALINDFSQLVLKHVCDDYISFKENKLYFNKIYVNLSQRQLLNPLFISNTLAALRQQNLPIEILGFEITEHILLYDIESTLKKLNALKVLGVDVILDDFGSGEASLNSLIRLPLSKVKVDCALIQQISTNKQAKQLVRGIIYMIHQMGLPVVAECVEDKITYDLLLEMKCDEYQGNYLQQPEKAKQIIDIFKGSNVN